MADSVQTLVDTVTRIDTVVAGVKAEIAYTVTVLTDIQAQLAAQGVVNATLDGLTTDLSARADDLSVAAATLPQQPAPPPAA